jgi:hypothetical protein
MSVFMKNVYVLHVLQNTDLMAFELLFAINEEIPVFWLYLTDCTKVSICIYQVALYVQLAKYPLPPRAS